MRRFWEENNCTERQDNRMEQHVNLVRWLTYSSERMYQNFLKKNHQKESKKKETKDPFELINCQPLCIVNRCIYYCVYSNISRFVILVLVHIYFGIKRAWFYGIPILSSGKQGLSTMIIFVYFTISLGLLDYLTKMPCLSSSHIHNIIFEIYCIILIWN